MNYDYIVEQSTTNKLIGYEIKDINIDKDVIVLVKNGKEERLNFDFMKTLPNNRLIIRNSNVMIYLIKK